MRTPTCSHNTSQMWVLREGWTVNTDTHWVCRTSVALLL